MSRQRRDFGHTMVCPYIKILHRLTTITPISSLFGVGEKFAKLFKNGLGIQTVGDLLNHFPARYEDYANIKPFSEVRNGEMVTVLGKIIETKNLYTARIKIQEIIITDMFDAMNCRNVACHVPTRENVDTGGSIKYVDTCKITFFNQPFLLQSLRKSMTISVSGMAERPGQKLQFKSPEWEIVKMQNVNIKMKNDPPSLSATEGQGNEKLKNIRGYPLKIRENPKQKNDEVEFIRKNLVHTGRLISIYPETRGISSKRLRALIFPLLNDMESLIQDYLPKEIRDEENLIDLDAAYENVHYPKNFEALAKANMRLAFDELFHAHLQAMSRKASWQKTGVKRIDADKFQSQIKDFFEKLPFSLTFSQKRAVEEIFGDLDRERPMNRLLEGDVGSGKTVVAAAAMYLAWLNGYSAAIMCPTEILANQHYFTINNLLAQYGVHIYLVTSSSRRGLDSHGLPADLIRINTKEKLDSRLRGNDTVDIRGNLSESQDKLSGQIRKSSIAIKTSQIRGNSGIYIGTHALIQDKVNLPNLNLVVIDEQHRFGVAQRGLLVKKGSSPHVLTMTATPIPRTIALTFYGDLDLSVLEELPQSIHVKTWAVPQEKRDRAYSWIEKQIEDNKLQVFIICPFIEQSETMESVKSARQEFEKLKKIFLGRKLELLTGKTKAREKDDIMRRFSRGEFSVLVATPVVEVGIDIAGAAIILIEGAERFGLAQLHQLRGRVGRRGQAAYCLLFTTAGIPVEATRRLKNMETIESGLRLAEIDLKIRGMGNIYGREQHGILEFKKANISDLYMVEKTKNAARKIFARLDEFPLLKKRLKDSKIENIVNN